MSELADLANRFLQACKKRRLLVATAESCTGGQIIALMTDLPGSSSMVDRGFVTYSNEAKMEMLGVSRETLDRCGAVSAETAREMANGALANSRAGLALSVTGIAGPDGGSEDKPVGLVWFGVAMTGRPTIVDRQVFAGQDRHSVRTASVRQALLLGLEALSRDDQDGAEAP